MSHPQFGKCVFGVLESSIFFQTEHWQTGGLKKQLDYTSDFLLRLNLLHILEWNSAAASHQTETLWYQ